MKRRIFSIALVLVFVVSLMPSAFAVGSEVKTAEELQVLCNRGGEVVLGSDIGMKNSLTVAANTTLDLNGYQLAIVTSRDSGIVIDLGQTLTVTDRTYTDSASDCGQMSVKGYRAGIQTSGATLIVNGAVIDARGAWASGIGGIDKSGYYDGGTVLINGGIVTAQGGCPGIFGGAGIGGMGYGAGSGANGNGGTITINGGTVTAVGGKYGAGIGGGGTAGSGQLGGGTGGRITITGGSVKATGGVGAYDIGGGAGSREGGRWNVTGGTIDLDKNGTNISAPSLKSCTVLGQGSGQYKGSYDADGSLIAPDDASKWAREGIAEARGKGLVPQQLQSHYTQATTRAEFCAFAVALYETVKGAAITERKVFTDTSDPNIEKMGGLGVVSGLGNDRFDPNGALTREQAATMLARLADALGRPLVKQSATFVDCGTISSWAMTQVGQVQAANIMGGIGDNKFDPSGSYTREQSIVTMLRLLKAVS